MAVGKSRREINSVAKGLKNFVRCEGDGQGQIATRQSLREHVDIGLHGFVLAGKQFSGPSKPGHHLVEIGHRRARPVAVRVDNHQQGALIVEGKGPQVVKVAIQVGLTVVPGNRLKGCIDMAGIQQVLT